MPGLDSPCFGPMLMLEFIFSIDEEDTIQTLTKVQTAMEKDYVRRYVQDLPVPLKVTPQEAVTILKGNCFMI